MGKRHKWKRTYTWPRVGYLCVDCGLGPLAPADIKRGGWGECPPRSKTMSWAERMAKPCPRCKTINPPDDGYVDEDDVLTIGYVCGECGLPYQFNTQLNEMTVSHFHDRGPGN